MALDKKITQLYVLTQAASNDVLAIVDVFPTPTTKQISAQNLFASPQPIGSTNASTGKFTTLQLPSGSIINEFSTDVTLAGDSDTAVPTEKAVKTYVDTAIINLNPNKIFAGDSSVVVADSTADGTVTFTVDSVVTGIFTSSGLQLSTGAIINEFSTDGTLFGNSDTAVPTEKAVKTYVDNAVINISGNRISQDDSYVQVIDDGTTAGYVEIVTDGIQVAYFDSQASTQRLGKASGAGRIEVKDTSITSYINTTTVTLLTEETQAFGDISNNYIYVDQTSNTITVTDNHINAFSITENGIRLQYGTTINKFSTDGTFSGNSDTTIPTEKAIKTYIDSNVSQVNVLEVYSDTTASSLDVVLVDTTSGDVNIILQVSDSAIIRVKKISTGSNKVVVTSSTGTIDNANQIEIETAYQSYTFISDGINFYTF